MSEQRAAATPEIPAAASPVAPPAERRWFLEEVVVRASATRRMPHLLLWATVVFVACALSWAAWFDIDEVARGEGRVIPMRQVQVIANLEGGILEEMLVREGDKVAAAQPVARIEETRFQSALREGEQGTLALKAQVDVHVEGGEDVAHVFTPMGATRITVGDAVAHAGDTHEAGGRLSAPMRLAMNEVSARRPMRMAMSTPSSIMSMTRSVGSSSSSSRG